MLRRRQRRRCTVHRKYLRYIGRSPTISRLMCTRESSIVRLVQAYAAGCNIVILASTFERVQIIPGAIHNYIRISCLDCSTDTGKIAAAYDNQICVFEPTPLVCKNSPHASSFFNINSHYALFYPRVSHPRTIQNYVSVFICSCYFSSQILSKTNLYIYNSDKYKSPT